MSQKVYPERPFEFRLSVSFVLASKLELTPCFSASSQISGDWSLVIGD